MARSSKCDAVCEDLAIIATFLEYQEQLERNKRLSPQRSISRDNWKNYGMTKAINRY
jgi:hypothetical protein